MMAFKNNRDAKLQTCSLTVEKPNVFWSYQNTGFVNQIGCLSLSIFMCACTLHPSIPIQRHEVFLHHHQQRKDLLRGLVWNGLQNVVSSYWQPWQANDSLDTYHDTLYIISRKCGVWRALWCSGMTLSYISVSRISKLFVRLLLLKISHICISPAHLVSHWHC